MTRDKVIEEEYCGLGSKYDDVYWWLNNLLPPLKLPLWKRALGLLKSNPEAEWKQIEDNMKEEVRMEEDKEKLEKELCRVVCWIEYHAIRGRRSYKDKALWKAVQNANAAYVDDAKLWRQ